MRLNKRGKRVRAVAILAGLIFLWWLSGNFWWVDGYPCIGSASDCLVGGL
jgi:hypothetical protein